FVQDGQASFENCLDQLLFGAEVIVDCRQIYVSFSGYLTHGRFVMPLASKQTFGCIQNCRGGRCGSGRWHSNRRLLIKRLFESMLHLCFRKLGLTLVGKNKSLVAWGN